MGLLQRIFGSKRERARYLPLYERIVAAARLPFWYAEGQVPDSVDGRFDMIAAILALVLIRIEKEGRPETRRAEALLAEIFIEDMDGSLRQIGIGDMVVGKHLLGLMGALGGRIAAFRSGLEDGDLGPAVRRNLFRDAPPSHAAVETVAKRLEAFAAALAATECAAVLEGALP